MALITNVLEEFAINSTEIGVNLIIALILTLIGIIIGKSVKLLLKRLAIRLKIERLFKHNILDTFLTIIKWAIYIFFIGIAIEQLNLPYLSTSFVHALSIIPKAVGALIILIIGYSIGNFIKKTIISTNKPDWKMLSEITFHFLVYLSFIISVQLIFSSDTFLIQWLTIVITVFYLLFMALLYTDVVRKK